MDLKQRNCGIRTLGIGKNDTLQDKKHIYYQNIAKALLYRIP